MYWVIDGGILIRRYAVAADLIVAHGVLHLPAAIAGVALNGVDDAILALLHDADVIAPSVQAIAGPVEKDDVAGVGLIIPVRPLAPVLKPLLAGRDALKAGDDAGIQVAALFGAPGHEDGTPRHAEAVTVPGPIRLAAHVAQLGQRHGHNAVIAYSYTVQHGVPYGAVLVGEQFRELFSLFGVEMELVGHLSGGLVGDSDIERHRFNGGLYLYGVAVLVRAGGRFHMGVRGGAIGYSVHLPEDVLQNIPLSFRHGGHLLCVRGVGVGLDGVDSQDLRPSGAGAGHLQLVMGDGVLDAIYLLLVVGVDLTHGASHGQAGARVLAGEEDTEHGAHNEPDQAHDNNDKKGHAAPGCDGGDKALGRGDDGLDGGDHRFGHSPGGRGAFLSRDTGGVSRDLGSSGGGLGRLLRYAGRLLGGLDTGFNGTVRGLDRISLRLGLYGAF